MTIASEVAAVKEIARALLPANATAVERAILTAELARFATINVNVVRWIIDPWRCPTPLLPYLAAAVSVDIWDAAWSEIDQRREIALSPSMHRLKGTLWAVKTALSRLGLPATVTEWWQTVPAMRRGTFRVFLDVTNIADTAPMHALARARVRSAKPKSRVADIQFGIVEEGPLGIAAGTLTYSTLVADYFVLEGPSEETGLLGIAAGLWTHSTIIAEVHP